MTSRERENEQRAPHSYAQRSRRALINKRWRSARKAAEEPADVPTCLREKDEYTIFALAPCNTKFYPNATSGAPDRLANGFTDSGGWRWVDASLF